MANFVEPDSRSPCYSASTAIQDIKGALSLAVHFNMFNKTSLLIAATLAASAVASPAPAPVAGTVRGTIIPLRKRTSLTQSNGAFDYDRTIAETADIINKHRQNLVVGVDIPSHSKIKGAVIKPVATIPRDVQARIDRSTKRRQSEALDDESHDNLWAGNITIGTPGQKFLIDSRFFSAGSSDLWVPSSTCTSSSLHKSRFNDSSSSSAKAQPLYSVGSRPFCYWQAI